MTHDKIRTMVRMANPIPDPAILGAPAPPFEQNWSTDMQKDDRVGMDREPSKRSPWPLIGVAAAVLIAIGMTSLLREQVDSTLLDQPFTAVGTANGFLDAYASNDADQVANYLADDADVSGLEGDPDWRLGLEFMRAAGYSLLVGRCVDGGTTDSTSWAYCPYAFHALRSEELGEGPFYGNRFLVEFEGREITSVSRSVSVANGFSETMWKPFAAWMKDTYPDELEILYEDGDGQSLQRVSEDSIPLWEQRTTEWVQEAGS